MDFSEGDRSVLDGTERRGRAGEQENMSEQGRMARDEEEGEESEVPVPHRTRG